MSADKNNDKNNDSRRDLPWDPAKYGFTYEEVFGNRDYWVPPPPASKKEAVEPSQEASHKLPEKPPPKSPPKPPLQKRSQKQPQGQPQRQPQKRAPVPTSHSIASLRITSFTGRPLFSRAEDRESPEPDYYGASPREPQSPRKRNNNGYTWNSMAEMIAAHVEELKKRPLRGTANNTAVNNTVNNTEQGDNAFVKAPEAQKLAMFTGQEAKKTSNPKKSTSPAGDDDELEEGEIDEREEGEVNE
ncbi:hypothetical protein F5B19DRAFT_458514 [Rostrohypoxylon terebratum]|nr:hypothetical protein F5B19DRAFT_458514 [Rostrohypoxylon terebratum]